MVPTLLVTPVIREWSLRELVGYNNWSNLLSRDNAIYDFSRKAVDNGLDIFRVFDALNYIGRRNIGVIH